jgi:hypothetical protein
MLDALQYGFSQFHVPSHYQEARAAVHNNYKTTRKGLCIIKCITKRYIGIRDPYTHGPIPTWEERKSLNKRHLQRLRLKVGGGNTTTVDISNHCLVFSVSSLRTPLPLQSGKAGESCLPQTGK